MLSAGRQQGGVACHRSKTCVSSTCTGLDYKACTWLTDFLIIFLKIAVRQTVGGRGAAEGNSKPCKPFIPTQYVCGHGYFGQGYYSCEGEKSNKLSQSLYRHEIKDLE